MRGLGGGEAGPLAGLLRGVVEVAEHPVLLHAVVQGSFLQLLLHHLLQHLQEGTV